MMTTKGGTSMACAACKYQRRKCSADCPLAPYFPPDQPKQFQNAHRLFGVSKIAKILDKIEPTQKAEAMRSIIYESNVRDRYPVHGCLGLIFTLHLQIQHTQMELDTVNAQLSVHRHQPFQLQLASSSSSSSSNTSHIPANYNLLFDSTSNNNNGDKNIAGALWAHDSYHNNNNNNNDDDDDDGACIGMHAPLAPLEMVGGVAENECDEISPYFDDIDEHRAYESSSESSMEPVLEDELKTAAACFALTSYQRDELIK